MHRHAGPGRLLPRGVGGDPAGQGGGDRAVPVQPAGLVRDAEECRESGIVNDTSVLFVGAPACAAVNDGTTATGTTRPHAHRATSPGSDAGCSPAPPAAPEPAPPGSTGTSTGTGVIVGGVVRAAVQPRIVVGDLIRISAGMGVAVRARISAGIGPVSGLNRRRDRRLNQCRDQCRDRRRSQRRGQVQS